MTPPVYELTIPEINEPQISKVVNADFNFMTLSSEFRAEAVHLQHSFQMARNTFGADAVSPKMLRWAFLLMRAASAFEIMHRDPEAFKALFKEVV